EGVSNPVMAHLRELVMSHVRTETRSETCRTRLEEPRTTILEHRSQCTRACRGETGLHATTLLLHGVVGHLGQCTGTATKECTLSCINGLTNTGLIRPLPFTDRTCNSTTTTGQHGLTEAASVLLEALVVVILTPITDHASGTTGGKTRPGQTSSATSRQPTAISRLSHLPLRGC